MIVHEQGLIDMRKPHHFFAFGLGSGLSPIAPGTAGTLAALLIWYMALRHMTWEWFCFITVSATVAGVFVCGSVIEDLKEDDPKGVVLDEFVGMWLVLLFLPEGVVTQFALLGISPALGPALFGFVLFRIFDWAKYGPVGWADRAFEGSGFGIMLDDVVAAALAIGVLHLIFYCL